MTEVWERIVETEKDDNFIKMTVPHDRVGVDIYTGDDLTELNFEQVQKLNRDVGKLAVFLKTYKPDAPPPFDITDEHPEVKMITHCSPKEESDPYICIIGHELSLEKAAALREWLGKALEYHNRKAEK
jgi:hypothetical protein